MISTSSQSTKSFGHEQFGASPTPSLRLSRNWIRLPNLRRQPSWANSWKPDFHNRSSLRSGIGRPAALKFHPHAFATLIVALRRQRIHSTAAQVREPSHWSAPPCSGPSESGEGLTARSAIQPTTEAGRELRGDTNFSVETSLGRKWEARDMFHDFAPTIPLAVTYGITDRMKDIEKVLAQLECLSTKWRSKGSSNASHEKRYVPV